MHENLTARAAATASRTTALRALWKRLYDADRVSTGTRDAVATHCDRLRQLRRRERARRDGLADREPR